jgi:hypothetical protein
MKTLLESNAGQFRILEAVIAAVIIFLVFSAAFFMVKSSENIVTQETADLNRLGYNTLHRIVESGAIEEILEKNQSVEAESAYLKMIVQESLPSAVYFKLTVYTCTGNLTNPFAPNPLSLSNAPTNELAESKEIASTSTIYTSKKGNIYYLVINLARAGQGYIEEARLPRQNMHLTTFLTEKLEIGEYCK